jgi:asparagine synthase (glutamine-hydrolysing)
MNNLGAHRGPDGEGYWLWCGQNGPGRFFGREEADDNHARGIIGLAHRRLAILDLSKAGLQPMSSHDGLLWITFNGEVYNYLELRKELENLGHEFRTKTDTEVILAAYTEWGTGCFSHFNGMWGMAIVDSRNSALVLSRDRLGVKPLYVWMKDRTIAFASEIKQFRALPDFVPVANMDAVAEYIDTGYEDPPATLFKGVQAFPPGYWATMPIQGSASLDPQPYWHPERVGVTRTIRDGETRERTRELFADAVKLRLRSDVPVGVCLSGGLDSSAIFGQAQLLAAESGALTYAFSATFQDRRFDESKYINIVLDRFKGRGYRTSPTAQGFLDDFDRFIYHHDEPTASLGQYAAWTVMRLAREAGVPVLLNGQGGDELFSGYWPAYYLFLRQASRRAPWKLAKDLLGSLLPGGNPALVSQLMPHLRQYRHRKHRRNRSVLLRRWQSNGFTLRNNWATLAQQLEPEQYRLSEIRRVHLPRLLKWDDRNSMAFSIEGRYPFLDYRMVEWALTLPPEVNLNRGWNKLLLRSALGAVLPAAVQWRRSKVGFETPQSEWIRSALHPKLVHWASRISDRLGEIVDQQRVKSMAEELFASKKLHRMDERQFLLLRLFFLDRWLSLFEVHV